MQCFVSRARFGWTHPRGDTHSQSKKLYGVRRFVIESQLDETNPASGWVCGPCFAVVGSVPLVQPTAVRRDPTGYARKSIPVHADQVSKIKHVYEVRPRKHKRGFDLISDALPFGRF